VAGAGIDHVLELRRPDKDRIFNLGYFTWVEQQGVPLDEFEARRRPAFWTEMRSIVREWDRRIEDLNVRTGALATVPA
jgi:cysteine synthase A